MATSILHPAPTTATPEPPRPRPRAVPSPTTAREAKRSTCSNIAAHRDRLGLAWTESDSAPGLFGGNCPDCNGLLRVLEEREVSIAGVLGCGSHPSVADARADSLLVSAARRDCAGPLIPAASDDGAERIAGSRGPACWRLPAAAWCAPCRAAWYRRCRADVVREDARVPW